MKKVTLLILFIFAMAILIIASNDLFYEKDSVHINETEFGEDLDQIENDYNGDLFSLDVFACTSVTAEVLKLHDRYGTLSVTLLVNSINQYISLESPEILLNMSDEIMVSFAKIGDEFISIQNEPSIGDLINVNIRCLDGRSSSRIPFTKEACYWSADFENINDTSSCYKK